MATDKVVHQLAIRAGNKLRDERLMLATAESCTGGLVAAAMTDSSSAVLSPIRTWRRLR
jgi:nicotinamide-nucleotide amidase